MKSISNRQFTKIKNDKFYSFDTKIGHALHMDLTDLNFTYIEPCVGGADLVDQIKMGTCVQGIDIDPEVPKDHDIFKVVEKGDARKTKLKKADYIISNPPFSKESKSDLRQMLDIFIKADVKATYMLLPLNWAANLDFEKYMKHCDNLRPIGRIKWIPGSKQSETKDHAWFRFKSGFEKTIMKPRVSHKTKTNQQRHQEFSMKNSQNFIISLDETETDKIIYKCNECGLTIKENLENCLQMKHDGCIMGCHDES